MGHNLAKKLKVLCNWRSKAQAVYYTLSVIHGPVKKFKKGYMLANGDLMYLVSAVL